MRHLKKYIQTHLELIQITLILAVFIISLAAGLTKSHDELMITLLVFLGSEIFVLTIGYLDQIMDYIFNEAKLIQTRSGSTDLKSFISGARNNIIIVGSTLSSLDSFKRELKNLPTNIKIDLYNTDLGYMKQNEELCRLQNHTDIQQFESRYNFFLQNVLSFLSSRENLHCFSLQHAMITTYIGIDTEMESSSSQILAEYYTLGEEYDLAFLVKPGCDLYNTYREQLRKIESLNKIQLK